MRLRMKFGSVVILTIVSVAATTDGWSAEPTVTNTAVQNRQKLQAETAKPSSSSKVVPAGYSSMAEFQDSVVDGSEVVQLRAKGRASRLYRESLIARAHRQKQEHFRVEHENLRDWTNYIRGYGPAVWVRNGPECGIHPPSIPFAKRVGGYNAPAWRGVTGIPKQPDISPLAVNAPDDEMRYRTVGH
ncbi:MAG: hypothetical protein WCH39_19025 [Schlesneria sp.]